MLIGRHFGSFESQNHETRKEILTVYTRGPPGQHIPMIFFPKEKDHRRKQPEARKGQRIEPSE